MKRLLAMILLAAFVASPAASWLCERTCGAEVPAAAQERDCHGSTAPSPAEAAQAVGDDHECGDHASPVLTRAPVRTEADSFVSLRPASATPVVPLPITVRFIEPIVADASPPRDGFRVPLRI
jgi:hypothetical protein